MAHFAQIDETGIVHRVIVAEQDFIDSGAVGNPNQWIQTSYNNNHRKNFAGRGYQYDRERDAFIPPRPSLDHYLNENTCQWESLVINEGGDKLV
jgi:hypothetical protein